MIDISILVVSRNNDNLHALFQSIEESNLGGLKVEVLCSWNGQDRPKAFNGSDKFEIDFHTNQKYNFSKNNNFLSTVAKGKYLLIMNDDMVLDPNCLVNSYGQVIAQHVGMVGANLRYPNDKIQHAGIFFKDGKPYHRYKHQLHYQDPRISYNLTVPAITGAYILIDREEFLAVRFDEECEIAAQDIILCIEYARYFGKDILYVADATALHYENVTRKEEQQTLTSENDLRRIADALSGSSPKILKRNERIRLRIVTEKPGWIMYRKAEEIAKRLPNAVINQDYPEANIHYYINYGYFQNRPKKGLLIGNYTHYDPAILNDIWESSAQEMDHCIAVSNNASNDLQKVGIAEDKITVIPVGADSSFKPKMTLGIVGRTYPGGRKGEQLVDRILGDSKVMENLQIVSTSDSWGVPVWNFEQRGNFYRAVDYLLVPALLEGGPVPFMEALACGTMAIAPPIGVVPDFPHIEYKTGDAESLIDVITHLKEEFVERKRRLSRFMEPYNWETWGTKHIALFHRLLDMLGH